VGSLNCCRFRLPAQESVYIRGAARPRGNSGHPIALLKIKVGVKYSARARQQPRDALNDHVTRAQQSIPDRRFQSRIVHWRPVVCRRCAKDTTLQLLQIALAQSLATMIPCMAKLHILAEGTQLR
jgi:hypothetical protein